MIRALVFFALACAAHAFTLQRDTHAAPSLALRMALNAELTKIFPRDFKNVSLE
jgi:hypothetical protein